MINDIINMNYTKSNNNLTDSLAKNYINDIMLIIQHHYKSIRRMITLSNLVDKSSQPFKNIKECQSLLTNKRHQT